MKSGSITAYLALTFGIMMSFVCVLITGARERAIQMKTEISMDAALYSVFAEYNRELLSQYDLLFIDTSYGGGQGRIANVEEHLSHYMNRNFDETKTGLFVKDLLALSATDVVTEKYSLATDLKGTVMQRQAVDYMKTKYGLHCMDKVKGMFDQASDNHFFTKNVSDMQQANQQEIGSKGLPKRKNKDDEWEEVAIDNPADGVNGLRASAILTLLVPKGQVVSKQTINPQNYVSKRQCEKGEGLLGRTGLSGTDSLLFDRYILEKAGCYTNLKEQSKLYYELEYILNGKPDDSKNLEATLSTLLFMRQASNFTYIMSDGAKIAEAEALAATLAAVILMPELLEPIKMSILFAWVFAESVYDVKHLLCGGKIPLIKNASSWHYSLEGMLSFQADASYANSGEQEEGFDYREYLGMLLLTKDHTTKRMRMMDVIEMDIRNTHGNRNFRLDLCLDYLEATVYVASKYGYAEEITRAYYYF